MPIHVNHMAVTVTQGPGLRAPFAAVIGDFDIPAYPLTDAADMVARLSQWLPKAIGGRLSAQGTIDNLPYWVMRLAQAITEARGKMDLPADCGYDRHRGWVSLGYYDAAATRQALQFALDATLSALQRVDAAAAMKPRADVVVNMQLLSQPDAQARALMRAARERKLPVYSVAGGSIIWQYGQGAKAWHLHTSATQSDSTTGVMLQQNKVHSNELVRRLGLPGVAHGFASSPQRALALAKQLGFPLVIKPLDSGRGAGVTVNVNHLDEVNTAFKNALRWSRKRQVIIERYVKGSDYRIMVTGGKFQWAILRKPPEVVCDGISSIAELIEKKNAGIPHTDMERGFAKHVAVDDEMRRVLATQKMNLDNRPPAGTVIRLRANANVSTGGSFVDVTSDIHADNRAMAEIIARVFRLDSTGIDFLTPDIRQSWRDIPCAVIEVNATPMLFCDTHARQLIACKFADGEDGCIPSLLVLCDNPAQGRQLYAQLGRPARGVGIATPAVARLDGFERRLSTSDDTSHAVKSLLLDPACEALVAICTTDEVRQNGLPLHRFDACLITPGAEPERALQDLMTAACGNVTGIAVDAIAENLPELLARIWRK